MYAGDQEIPYASDFIQLLREQDIPYLYVTNNSSRTPEAVAEHLRHMRIPASAEEIVTSSQAAAEYIAHTNGLGTKVFAIGEEGLRVALLEAGLQLVDDEPDVVVQGIDRTFDYAKLNRAASFIREGIPYVLTNPDAMIPSNGTFLPGAGSISSAIQMASGTKPVVIGKPCEPIISFALHRLRETEQVWVVGDNLLTDIAAGAASGLRTALVLTGLATPDNVEHQVEQSGIVPDVIVQHLMELIPSIQQRD